MDYITPKDYFAGYEGDLGILPEHRANAAVLLQAVNYLLALAIRCDVKLPNNPVTKSLVSGQRDGGWRPQSCPIGASKSAHKQGLAVDVYDPNGELDNWLTDKILEEHGLYREDPHATTHWCHLTIRAPGSGKRTFMP